jgi:hypothetical protein
MRLDPKVLKVIEMFGTAGASLEAMDADADIYQAVTDRKREGFVPTVWTIPYTTGAPACEIEAEIFVLTIQQPDEPPQLIQWSKGGFAFYSDDPDELRRMLYGSLFREYQGSLVLAEQKKWIARLNGFAMTLLVVALLSVNWFTSSGIHSRSELKDFVLWTCTPSMVVAGILALGSRWISSLFVTERSLSSVLNKNEKLKALYELRPRVFN